MISMADSQSLRGTQDPLLDWDVAAAAAAAQQLMQLSDEDNTNYSSNIGRGNNKNGDQEVERSQEEITSAKIEEIFGKDDDEGEICRPKRKKYRSLENIYSETKPIDVRDGKKVKLNRRICKHNVGFRRG